MSSTKKTQLQVAQKLLERALQDGLESDSPLVKALRQQVAGLQKQQQGGLPSQDQPGNDPRPQERLLLSMLPQPKG